MPIKKPIEQKNANPNTVGESKMGRKRKYASNAIKQKAYRTRLREKEARDVR